MRTLFGKIFLWFFFAQVLLGTAMFSVGFSQREATTPQPVRDFLTDHLRWQSATAVLLERAGMLQQLDLPQDPGGARTVVLWHPNGGALKPIGKNIGEDEDASRVIELAHQADETGGVQWMQSEDSWGGAQATKTKNGTIIVVREIPRRPRSFMDFWDDLQTSQGRTRLFTALSVMAIVCYGLARYITSPVTRLRAATHKLAEGDLTARVGFGLRGGDELISLGHDFDRMAQRLETSTQSERRLLGDISHELRSPLARLSVALDLVEQGRARAESRGEALPESSYISAFDRIRRESGRLNEMIGQLLELTRLESLAEDAPHSQSATFISLNRIVEEVVADAKYEARSRSCDVELSENQPCTLRGIEPLLHSAIENVVRNALRYTAANTAVQVQLRRVETEDGAQAILDVRDFGPGVPEESLELLFRPFYRVAEGRERQSGGVGLGLAIAHRALKVHGASIEAQNAVGGGLKVEIRLSLPPQAANAAAPQLQTAASE